MKLSKEVRDKLTKEQFRYYKTNGRLPDDVSVVETVSMQPPGTASVTVLCVRYGTKYGREYVERLRNMVARHLTIPYEFVCLTDDPRPIEGVRTLYQQSSGYNRMWWQKVHMFDPTLDISGRILYLDLDVIIGNDMNKLVTNLDDKFMGILDFNRKFHPSWKYLNSSVMSWMHRSQTDIWTKFIENKQNAQRMQGDQDWIWHCAKNRITFWPKEWIQSYKWEIRSREELHQRTGKGGFKTIKTDGIDPNCAIAVFHGDPNPHDVPDTFVVDNWR